MTTAADFEISRAVDAELVHAREAVERLRALGGEPMRYARALRRSEVLAAVMDEARRADAEERTPRQIAGAVVGERLADGVWIVAVCEAQFLETARARVLETGVSSSAAPDVRAEAALRTSTSVRNGTRPKVLTAFINHVIRNAAVDYARKRDNRPAPLSWQARGEQADRESREGLWDERGSADDDAVEILFGPDYRLDPRRVAEEFSRLPPKEADALNRLIKGAGPFKPSVRQLQQRGRVRLTLRLADQLAKRADGQVVLLEALASSAAVNMAAAAYEAIPYVSDAAKQRFLEICDRDLRSRGKARRLRAMLQRAQRFGGPPSE